MSGDHSTSPLTKDVKTFLRQTSKGKLVYDRDWEREGRLQGIISDIKNRLVSITITPKDPPPQPVYEDISPPDSPPRNQTDLEISTSIPNTSTVVTLSPVA